MRGKILVSLVLLIFLLGGSFYAVFGLIATSSPDAPPIIVIEPTPTVEEARFIGPPCALDDASIPEPPPTPLGRAADYLHTCGNRIYDSHGREFTIIGLNWYGMETPTFSPSGLNTRNWADILDQIASLGYNTLRLPYSNELLHTEKLPSGINYYINPDLAGLSPLEVLDKLISGARERGLRVILDRHWPTGSGPSDLWYTDEVTEQQWIDDWQMLASRYLGDDTVIAADLSNEPHGRATWGSGKTSTDWRLAAERAGNAVLAVNPYLLIFVEGIGQYQDEQFWWGGDLRGVAEYPLQFDVPNRLVYSPHDYGPEVYPQTFFFDQNFPNNLADVWDRHWGYIQDQGTAPVVLGEFGGEIAADERAQEWKAHLLDYAMTHGIGLINWPLTPKSFEAADILVQDAQTVLPRLRELAR